VVSDRTAPQRCRSLEAKTYSRPVETVILHFATADFKRLLVVPRPHVVQQAAGEVEGCESRAESEAQMR
jgi:hypothetical protein